MQKRVGIFRRHILNGLFLWVLIVPLVILDIFGELYHRIGFRLCKIPLVKRSEYIKIDRHKLKYLNLRSKIGCVYCGYANGLLHYASEIAARTEKFWCAIKHENTDNFKAPKHHEEFIDYGDEDAYKEKYSKS